MRNRIKELVDSRGLTVYQFWKATGISRTTAYDLYKDPSQYPGKNVMDAICDTYKVQPGELLVWIPNKENAFESKSNQEPDSQEDRSLTAGGAR